MSGLRTLAAFSLVLAVATSAASGSITAGFHLGVTMPVSELDDDFDRDVSYGGFVTLPLVGALAVRGEVSRNSVSFSQPLQELCDSTFALGLNCDGGLRFTQLGAGLQYGGTPGRGMLSLSTVRLQPYLFATIGHYQVRGEVSSTERLPLLVTADDSFFGVAGGGGVNVRIGENWGVSGDLHVHTIRFELEAARVDEWYSFVTPSAGIWISF